MARRRMKRKAPRRSRGISVLNTLESYAYASILSRGLMGNSPLGVISVHLQPLILLAADH